MFSTLSADSNELHLLLSRINIFSVLFALAGYIDFVLDLKRPNIVEQTYMVYVDQ